MENNEKETISIEEAFTKLDQTIAELESEEVTLERSFSLYKEGMELIWHCEKEIDTVEKNVALLGENGEISEFS